MRAAVATLVGALIVVAAAAGLRSRTLTDEAHVHRRFRPAAWPWELLIVAGAAYAWVRLGTATVTRTSPGSNGGAVVHIPAALLVVPLLIIVGAVALLARLATIAMRRRAGGRGGSRSTVWYLGWRRIVREAVIVAVLGAATAMPIGLATYGAAVTDSVQATIDGESHLIVGADVVATLTKPTPVPPALAKQTTAVLALRGVKINGVSMNLWAVDPARFGRIAYWNAQISGQSLDGMLAPLRVPHAAGAPWAALGSSALVPSGSYAPDWGDSTDTRYDVHTVANLPAQQGGFGSLIVPAASLGSAADFAIPQLWIRGDPDEIIRQLDASALPITYIATAEKVYTGTVFEPLTYTFEYLTALSILTGIVTVVGLMLYIEARSPGHRRGYVMARRMGLAAGTHRRALLLELAVPLITGLVLGIALAMGLTFAFSSGFDVDPTSPPHTLLAFPGTAIGGIALAVVLVAIVAAVFAQFRVGRADPSEVLRDTI
jgi:putative ABC transport system permease protein